MRGGFLRGRDEDSDRLLYAPRRSERPRVPNRDSMNFFSIAAASLFVCLFVYFSFNLFSLVLGAGRITVLVLSRPSPWLVLRTFLIASTAKFS